MAADRPRPEDSDRVSETMRARTRTMSTDGTSEFSPVDYQAPDSPVFDAESNSRTKVDDDTIGRLDKRAVGVSSLRETVAARVGQGEGRDPSAASATAEGARGGRDRRSQRPMSRRKLVTIIVCVVVLAAALIAGACALFVSALESLNQPSDGADSASYATDQYVLIAQSDETGQLAQAYIAYVDSINGRTELCRLDPRTMTSTSQTTGTLASDGSVETLSEVWAARGLDGLVRSVETMGGIDIVGGMSVDSSQMEQILDLASDAETQVATSDLASSIASSQSGDAALSKSAIRGLLVTIKDIGPDGYVLLTAPTSEQDNSGTADLQLDYDRWTVMLGGMRDTAQEVSAS